MFVPKALVRAAFAAWASLVSLSGCQVAPEAAPLPVAPAPEVTPLEVTAALPPVTTTRMLRVFGQARLPKAVGGLANAKDGKLVGAPVELRDVPSGRVLAKGVTFYDGSFVLEVPADLGKRPVLVTVALVDDATGNPLFPLAAPVQLAPELGEQSVAVDPASTAWYALLYRLAASQTKAPPPDWTILVPGVTSRVLAGMILGSAPGVEERFSLLAAGLEKPATASDLRLAITALVDRLIGKAKPVQE